jgi:hypothetical protein
VDRNEDGKVYAHEGSDGIKDSWKLSLRLSMLHVTMNLNAFCHYQRHCGSKL